MSGGLSAGGLRTATHILIGTPAVHASLGQEAVERNRDLVQWLWCRARGTRAINGRYGVPCSRMREGRVRVAGIFSRGGGEHRDPAALGAAGLHGVGPISLPGPMTPAPTYSSLVAAEGASLRRADSSWMLAPLSLSTAMCCRPWWAQNNSSPPMGRVARM